MYILVLLGKKDVFSIFEEIIGDLWHLMDYVVSDHLEAKKKKKKNCGKSPDFSRF